MIKVVAKTLAIIEVIAERPEEETSVSVIAERAGVNKATATRILKDLLEAGYVSQASTRKGYTLGPMAYHLASRGTFRRDVVEAAQPVVAECAKRIGESVLVACLQSGRRYILCHENGNPELEITVDQSWYDDLYQTATGRLLLAHAPKEEVLKYVARRGLPSAREWDGIDSEKSLLKRLDALRNDGMVVSESPNGGLVIMAFPIVRKGAVEAALGISIPTGSFKAKGRERIVSAGKDAADRISESLERSLSTQRLLKGRK